MQIELELDSGMAAGGAVLLLKMSWARELGEAGTAGFSACWVVGFDATVTWRAWVAVYVDDITMGIVLRV